MLWIVCGHGNGGLLHAGETQPLVRVRVRRVLCARVGVRISTRSLAIRAGRSCLVRRSGAPLVACDDAQVTKCTAKFHLSLRGQPLPPRSSCAMLTVFVETISTKIPPSAFLLDERHVCCCNARIHDRLYKAPA